MEVNVDENIKDDQLGVLDGGLGVLGVVVSIAGEEVGSLFLFHLLFHSCIIISHIISIHFSFLYCRPTATTMTTRTLTIVFDAIGIHREWQYYGEEVCPLFLFQYNFILVPSSHSLLLFISCSFIADQRPTTRIVDDAIGIVREGVAVLLVRR